MSFQMSGTPISPMPESFASENERDYWHSAQDIAFRAGKALMARDGATWLKSDDEEVLVCRPSDPERIWFETWKALDDKYPLLSRMWIGGWARTKPGEMEHRRARRGGESGVTDP